MNKIVLNVVLLLVIALMLFTIIIPFFYLRYIDRLKDRNCKCSESFNRNFIQFYSAYIYVSIIVLVLVSFLVPPQEIKGVMETHTRLIMSTGLSFLAAYSLYYYQNKVYKDNCECAIQSWEPKVMKVHSYIVGVLVFISMLNILNILMGNNDLNKSLNSKLARNIRK